MLLFLLLFWSDKEFNSFLHSKDQIPKEIINCQNPTFLDLPPLDPKSMDSMNTLNQKINLGQPQSYYFIPVIHSRLISMKDEENIYEISSIYV